MVVVVVVVDFDFEIGTFEKDDGEDSFSEKSLPVGLEDFEFEASEIEVSSVGSLISQSHDVSETLSLSLRPKKEDVNGELNVIVAVMGVVKVVVLGSSFLEIVAAIVWVVVGGVVVVVSVGVEIVEEFEFVTCFELNLVDLYYCHEFLVVVVMGLTK